MLTSFGLKMTKDEHDPGREREKNMFCEACLINDGFWMFLGFVKQRSKQANMLEVQSPWLPHEVCLPRFLEHAEIRSSKCI